jgi:hypothetical protein
MVNHKGLGVPAREAGAVGLSLQVLAALRAFRLHPSREFNLIRRLNIHLYLSFAFKTPMLML